MKRTLLIVFVVLLWTCGTQASKKKQPASKQKEAKKHKQELLTEEHYIKSLKDEVSSIYTNFAFQFYKEIAKENTSENIFFSPLSITTSLAVLFLGTKSSSKQELLQAFRMENKTERDLTAVHTLIGALFQQLSKGNEELQFDSGNSLHIDKDFDVLASFLNDTKGFYDTEVLTTDFSKPKQATQFINEYVKNKTNGKITQLLDKVTPLTKLIFVNYIYFKGLWKSQFDPKATRQGKFSVDGKTTVKVPMMVNSDTKFKILYDRDLSSTVLQLPYCGNISMLVLLPDQGGIKRVEQKLTATTLKSWLEKMAKSTPSSASIFMPKFSLEHSYSLQNILQRIGVKTLFTNAADLSGISGQKNLKVSKIIHKATLDVDEKGTEAAAATGVEIILLSAPLDIRINKPFILLIYAENTGTILFMGRVMNPLAKKG